MRLKIKINDGNLSIPSSSSSDIKITPQDLLFNVNIKIPDYMQKDFLASIFYNSNNLDKRNYAFQKLIVENDSAFWRSSVVNECEFDLSEKKLRCQYIDNTEMEWDMPRYCEIKLNTIIMKLKRGKRKINLEKKKLIEKEEAKKNNTKESQQQNLSEIQKSKKVFSNLALSFFPFATSTTYHNKLGRESHHNNAIENITNTNSKITVNDNDNIVKNNIKEMILRKMYEYLKSKLKSELIDIYTQYIQHDHLNDILPQNYYIWLTNSYLHRYEQHILDTESMMKVQIYGMEVLNDALKKMRQQFITRFIEINHDKELYESLEVRLQDINSLIIDKKIKSSSHESSKKLGILKFFKRSGQKHKEESKEVREVKRLKTEMKQIQFMMSSLKLATDPSKRIIESKAIIRDQSILPVLDNSNTSLEDVNVQPDTTITVENASNSFEDVNEEELTKLPSKKQRALKYKDIDDLCYKLMMNDLNLDEDAILKYLAIKEHFSENNDMDHLTSPEDSTLLGEQFSNAGTEILNSVPMDDKKRKYLDYRKMISNLPQPKFILLHFLYPPFLDNMKKGILNDINELKDELLDLLIRSFSNPSNFTGDSKKSTFEILKIIEQLLQQKGFIDYLFKQICSSITSETPSPNDTIMIDVDENVDTSGQTVINDNDHSSSSPSLELPMQAPLISSTNDHQLMMSEKLLPATPTLLSTVSSFITNAETTAEETLTQISHNSNHHGSPRTNDTIIHNSTKVINTVETIDQLDSNSHSVNINETKTSPLMEMNSNQGQSTNENSNNSGVSELNENLIEKSNKNIVMEEDKKCSNAILDNSNVTLINHEDKNEIPTENDYRRLYNDLDPVIKTVIDDILNTLKQKFKMYNETYATIVTVQEKNKELLMEINQSTTLNPMDNKEKILNKLLTPVSNTNVHTTTLSPTSAKSPHSNSASPNPTSPNQTMEEENMEELDHTKKQESTLSRLITTSSTLLDSPQNSVTDSFEILSNRIGNMSNEINKKMEYDYKQQKFSSYMLFSSYEEIKHITKEFFVNLTSEKNEEFSITDFEFTSSYLHLVATLNVIRYQVEDLFHKNINLMLEHENWRNERNKILTSIQERSIQENDAIQERRRRNNRIQTYLFKQYQLRQQYYAQQLKNKQEYYDKQQLYLLKQNKQIEMLKKSENQQKEKVHTDEGHEDGSESNEIVHDHETEENTPSSPMSSPQTEVSMNHQESKETENNESQEKEEQSEFDRIFGDDSFEEDEEIIEDILESSQANDENKTTEIIIKSPDSLNASLTIIKNNTDIDTDTDTDTTNPDGMDNIESTKVDGQPLYNPTTVSTEIVSETETEGQNKDEDSTPTASTPFFGPNKRIPIIYSRTNPFVSTDLNTNQQRIPKKVKQLSLNLESRIVKETYFQQEEKNMARMSSSLDRNSFFDRDYSIFRQRLMQPASETKDSIVNTNNPFKSTNPFETSTEQTTTTSSESHTTSKAQDIPTTGGLHFNLNNDGHAHSTRYSSSLNNLHNESEANIRKLRRLSWHGGAPIDDQYTPKSTFEFNQNLQRINEMNNFLTERFTSVLLKKDSIENIVSHHKINENDTCNEENKPKVSESSDDTSSIPQTAPTTIDSDNTSENINTEENQSKESEDNEIQRNTASPVHAMDIDEDQTPKESPPLKFKYSFTNHSSESLNCSTFAPSTPTTPSFDNFGYTYQKSNHMTSSPSAAYTMNSRNYKKKQENTKKILRYRKSKKTRV